MPVMAGRLAVVQGDRRTGVGIPILGYLVDTPRELVVVDCGLSTRWRGGGAVHLGPDDSPSPGTPYMPELEGPSLAEQVAAMGLKPDRLVCTHLHHDHSSGASELGLTLEASAPELERLAGPRAEALGYPAEELAGVPTRAVELDPQQPFGPFMASTHLNPDLIAVDTSGHTPGSISILACLGAAWVLICGDAVYPMDGHAGAAQPCPRLTKLSRFARHCRRGKRRSVHDLAAQRRAADDPRDDSRGGRGQDRAPLPRGR
jgi:glyoxylase-like metal-dependent hydrolase (beta-lactamase superfamily II)